MKFLLLAFSMLIFSSTHGYSKEVKTWYCKSSNDGDETVAVEAAEGANTITYGVAHSAHPASPKDKATLISSTPASGIYFYKAKIILPNEYTSFSLKFAKDNVLEEVTAGAPALSVSYTDCGPAQLFQ